MTRYGTVDVAIECCFGIVQSVPSGLQFCGIAAAVFVQHASEQCHSPPTLLRPLRLPASPEGSAVTPGTLPTTTILSLSLSLSDRRLWRAWENHPGWLHTPSEPLNHLRNQDRTFASTSWSTTHLSSQSLARDLRPPPHRPSSRTQLGWGSGTCDPFSLLDAVPRDLCSLQTKS